MMTRYSDVISSKRSIYYPKPDDDRLDISSHVHMFTEDLHLSIMPIGGESKNPNFDVSVAPPSQDIMQMITSGLVTRDGYDRGLKRKVCQFIDETAHNIAYFGISYYEIVYIYSDNSKSGIEGFRLEHIHNHCIHNALGLYWQKVPKEYRQYNGGKIINYLPKKNIVKISLPKSINTVRKHRSFLKTLSWFDEAIIPEFVMEDMKNQTQTTGYDFSTYRMNRDIFLAKSCKKLGWPVRGLLSDRSVEYYQIYRSLKFEKVKSVLREHILLELNNALIRIGNEMGFQAKIVVNGLPSSKDYDDYLEKLSNGELQFSDAIELLRI